jgi:hypothetical protein
MPNFSEYLKRASLAVVAILVNGGNARAERAMTCVYPIEAASAVARPVEATRIESAPAKMPAQELPTAQQGQSIPVEHGSVETVSAIPIEHSDTRGVAVGVIDSDRSEHAHSIEIERWEGQARPVAIACGG